MIACREKRLRQLKSTKDQLNLLCSVERKILISSLVVMILRNTSFLISISPHYNVGISQIASHSQVEGDVILGKGGGLIFSSSFASCISFLFFFPLLYVSRLRYFCFFESMSRSQEYFFLLLTKVIRVSFRLYCHV